MPLDRCLIDRIELHPFACLGERYGERGFRHSICSDECPVIQPEPGTGCEHRGNGRMIDGFGSAEGEPQR